jgi:hypothetical protein
MVLTFLDLFFADAHKLFELGDTLLEANILGEYRVVGGSSARVIVIRCIRSLRRQYRCDCERFADVGWVSSV